MKPARCQAGEATGLQSHKVAELHRSSAATETPCERMHQALLENARVLGAPHPGGPLRNTADGKGLLALLLQLFPVGNWV